MTADANLFDLNSPPPSAQEVERNRVSVQASIDAMDRRRTRLLRLAALIFSVNVAAIAAWCLLAGEVGVDAVSAGFSIGLISSFSVFLYFFCTTPVSRFAHFTGAVAGICLGALVGIWLGVLGSVFAPEAPPPLAVVLIAVSVGVASRISVPVTRFELELEDLGDAVRAYKKLSRDMYDDVQKALEANVPGVRHYVDQVKNQGRDLFVGEDRAICQALSNYKVEKAYWETLGKEEK